MAAGEIYAFVQSGAVVSIYTQLPYQYGDVTSFNMLTDAELLTYGFYPYSESTSSFDPITQTLGSFSYTINPTTVVGSYAVVSLSSEEIAANMAAYAVTLSNLLLDDLYSTDWIDGADSGLSTGQQTAYTTLRASMVASRTAMNGYNETQLNSLNTALSDATQSDCRSRFLDFTNNMTALQTALTAL